MGRRKIVSEVSEVKIAFRAPANLQLLVKKYLKTFGIHMNASDFYRQAIIEKIRRDAPFFLENLQTGKERKEVNGERERS